jgi:hypothetical protein
MKSRNKIIAVIFSLLSIYEVQAAPGKTIFYNIETGGSNNVAYFKKSISDVPLKSGWVKKQVAISWQTTAEVNTSYFELQRSFNDNDYETIDTIKAVGNAKNMSAYSFVDASNENRRGQTYYRLKAVFVNGDTQFTSSVKTKKTGVFDMNKSYAVAAGMKDEK